jgi:hypothetical protein
MTTATSDVNIFDLDAAVEPLETIDGAALDAANEYSPTIPLGYNNFIFAGLDDERPIGSVERQGKPVLEVTFTATHLKADGTEGKTVNYVRANGYKSEKMRSSSIAQLIHALGLTDEYNKTAKRPSDVLALLQGAEGARATFRAKVAWRHYDKDTKTTTATTPKVKIGDKYETVTAPTEYTTTKGDLAIMQPWPKNDDGTLARHPGNEELSDFAPATRK